MVADRPTIAQVESGALTTALASKLDMADRPQIKYLGSYVNMQKLEFVDSLLSLGTSAGEYAITSQPQMASVQGHAMTYASGTTAVAGTLEATDRVQVGSDGDPMGSQSVCMRFARPLSTIIF